MPIITTATLTLLAKFIAEKGLEKAFETSVEEISKDAINWLESLFKRNGKVREELSELQEQPDSPARLNAVNAIFEKELEDNPQSIAYLKEILKKTPSIKIANSKNVNTGKISTNSGNIQLGDNYGK